MRNEDLHCAQVLFSAVVIFKHFFLDLLFKLAVAHALKPTHDLLKPFYAIMKMNAQYHKVREDDDDRYNNPNWYEYHDFIISVVQGSGQYSVQ